MKEKQKWVAQAENEQDKLIFARIYDLAMRGGCSDFFCNPACRVAAERFFSAEHPIFWGGVEDCERTLVSFSGEPPTTIACLYLSAKGGWSVSHRDILGAVLHLGLDRSKIGDIFVGEEGAYLFCIRDLVPFLEQNLSRVASCAVQVSQPEVLPNREDWVRCSSVQRTVSSLRHDCVLAGLLQVSRTQAQAWIRSGRVHLNWIPLTSVTATAKAGDLYAVRGIGRLQVEEVGGITRKGKTRITAKRFL